MPYSEFMREYQSGLLENIHFGHLSAINDSKEEIISIGQDHQPVYFRSASKPFQAIPIFMTNLDGYGAPVFAIPLKHMAVAYLKLARSELIDDAGIRKAVIKLTAIMNKESKIIASDNFTCTALSQDKNIVAKGGA